jgi:hypothetical protein
MHRQLLDFTPVGKTNRPILSASWAKAGYTS